MRQRFALALIPLVLGACSLLLKFEYEDDPPCSRDGKCLPGYSCQITRCIEHGSVDEGQTCTASVQCETGLCGTRGLSVCRQRCAAVYVATLECSTSKACMLDDPDDPAAGACLPDECGGACPNAGDVCVPIRAAVGACEESCTVACSGAAPCTQSCLDSAANCQPLGQSQTLACMPKGTGVHGDACNLVDRLCDTDHACIRPPDGRFGICLRYCEAANPIACNGLVDPATGGQSTCNGGNGFSFCGALPNDPVAIGPECGDGSLHGLELCDGTAWPAAGPGPDCFDFGLATVEGTHAARCVDCVPDFSTCEFQDYCVHTALNTNNICDPCLELGDIEDPDCAEDCTSSNGDCADRYFYDGASGSWTCLARALPDPDCGTCGNALIEGQELCDTTNMGALATCTDYGFTRGGLLACGADCMPSFRNCIQ